MDGGNIEFRSFNQGVVSVVLQGSLQRLSIQHHHLKIRH